MTPNPRVKTETKKDIAARLGISRQALHARLRRGMDPEKATSLGPLATNPNPVKTLIARAEGRDTITQMCLDAGISESTYYTRKARGLSHEDCLKVAAKVDEDPKSRSVRETAHSSSGSVRETAHSRPASG